MPTVPKKVVRALPAVVCALVPVAVVVLLVSLVFGRSLLSFTPSWSDEIDYWREIYTFGHYGFGGGYYAINGIPAAASFSHFGAHGPAFPMLFGPLSALTGWSAASGPLYNLAALSAAMLGYFWLVRPDIRQMLLSTVSILVFWPILLYIPSSMQETVHQSLAVLLAGVFYVMIRERDQAATRVFVVGVVALAIASLLRATWAPLFFPLFLFRSGKTTWRNSVRAALLATPLIIVSFAASVWLSSPYPNFISELLTTAVHAPWAAVHLFISHVRTNTNMLLIGGQPLEQSLRYQVLAAVCVAVCILGYQIYRKRRDTTNATAQDDLSLLHILNLVPVLVISVALYDIFDWRDFRVFAPHVLLAILVSIPFSRRVYYLVPLALNLLTAFVFVSTFQTFHAVHFATDVSPNTVLASAVRYQPGANPWRNTILVDFDNYTAALLWLPPGIGVSVILGPSNLKRPIESEYLLVSDATMKQLGSPTGWDLVGTTPSGKLYVRAVGLVSSPASAYRTTCLDTAYDVEGMACASATVRSRCVYMR